MALTSEILRANAVLSALTDEQINAITKLSENDENSVIAKKTGEIYGGLDADILAVSGISKNGTEKTFDYAKRVLGELKDQIKGVAGLQKSIEDLTKEKARLEKAIAEGAADTETVKALKQAKADLTSVQNQYNDLKKQYDKAVSDHAANIHSLRIESELNAAKGGFKFKPGLPESATAVLVTQAIDKIKGLTSEFIDDGKGGKLLVYKDASGAIMRNPNNQLNPYTSQELLHKELETMGILDNGRQQTGGGTTGGAGGQGGAGGVIDISGAKTRTQAYDIIANGLIAQGKMPGSAEFDTAMTEAWKDNNISALPEN